MAETNPTYLGTVGGIRVRFVNMPSRNPNSARSMPPFNPNWNAYRVDTGAQLTEAWSSRAGAAQSVAYKLHMNRA